MTKATDMRSRANFNYWTTVGLRYCDQDPLGHVNNAAMAAFLEQARVELVAPLLKAGGHPSIDIVLARVIIDYLSELTYPGQVAIGTRVARVGTKSLHLVHGVFKGETDECAATGECVLVFFDLAARRSIAPPPDVRAELDRLF